MASPAFRLLDADVMSARCSERSMACSESDYDFLRQLGFSRSANLIDPSRNASFDSKFKPMAQLAGASNL